MFLLVPLTLIFASVIAIFVIVFRKKSYLEKLFILNVAGSGTGPLLSDKRFNWSAYVAEFLPELKVLFDKLKLHEYKVMWLTEAEKFLRRTRLVSLRVDRMSDILIKKIRRSHINRQLNGQIVPETAQEPKEGLTIPDKTEKQAISPNFLKNEEQRLIIEIAKNPKDPHLYEILGDLYLEMENFTDAKESFEAAIELNPSNELARQKLSSALEKLASQN